MLRFNQGSLVWWGIVLALFLIVGIIYAHRCEAGWCSYVPCRSSSQCGRGCMCIKSNSMAYGECYSVD